MISATLEPKTIPFDPYYDHDGITIYNADCLKVLPWLGKFDLLLTDPPYGIGTWNDRSKTDGTRFKAADFSWDIAPTKTELEAIREAAAKAIVFGWNHLEMPPTKKVLIWDKRFRGLHFNDCELAGGYGVGEACRVFEYEPAKAERKRHPTEKPLAVMQWCLKQVGDVSSVVDPFMGSGTTLVAAKLAGIKAVGIEINEKYCEIAANRLSQGVLF